MRTLLLADDSVTIQRVIALTFANEEFRVITVSDGQQAIDRIAAQPPDIVLAGTTMPNLNGYDVSRYVRNQPGLKNVPVLLLTGAFESVDEARLKASGASGTIEKPFEPTIVISRVKELLGMKATPTPATGRSVTPANSPAGTRPPRPPVVTPKSPVPPKPKGQSAPVAAHAPAPTPAPAPPEPTEPTPALPELAAPLWDDIPEEGSRDPGTRSAESSALGGDRADYLDSLDAAFDTLDARLQTREGDESAVPRNPDAPQRQSGPADPRSPGRLPTPGAKGG
ncbi:MAG: response regulator, partial [Vicinamibacterales bacterium]